MRSVVLNFGVIRRARVHRGVQVVGFHQKPVRCAGVSVAGMAGGIRREGAGKGIHPGA